MSDQSDILSPHRPSETAQSAPPRTPVRIATDALDEIIAQVNRALGLTDDNEATSPVNVVKEREFVFDDLDPSLLLETDRTDTQPTNRRVIPYVSRPPSSLSLREEYSLTSHESVFEEAFHEQTDRMATGGDVTQRNGGNPGNEHEESIERPGPSESRSRIGSRDILPEIGGSPALTELLRDLAYYRNRQDRILERLQAQFAHPTERPRVSRAHGNYGADISYGRTQGDVRARMDVPQNYLRLKEALDMIPDFDGTSRNRVREFLNASSYAMKNIDPTNEYTLLEAILCTKLKGRAMLDFQTRDIQDYEQLKEALEKEYLSKRSTSHLQIEFNSLKQKHGENAQDFGRRVDTVAMELYEAMIEEGTHEPEHQKAMLNMIKLQALHNYQHGLNEEIRLIVRSQKYKTLQEAMAGASSEEKVKGPNYRNVHQNRTRSTDVRQHGNSNPQCQRCGKPGHYARDCRSKFVLPRAEGHSRVNTVNKYCQHCKRSGHVRDECWSLHGRPNRDSARPREASVNQTARRRYYDKNTAAEKYKQKNKTERDESSDDKEENTRRARPIAEYKVSHMKREMPADTALDLVTLPIREVKRNKVNLLYDTGAAISMIKMANFKDTAILHEEKIKLTGITGHTMSTIGKVYATIILNKREITHPFYVTRDDAALEYDGILGADFIQKYVDSCDYRAKQIKINNNYFRLHPHKKITLRPRSETIVQVTVERNVIGVTQTEEPSPGVFIGSCLVEPREGKCPVSILNTTEKETEISVPHVEVEELPEFKEMPVNVITKGETKPNRQEVIRNLLRITHLNREEEKTLVSLCEEYSDIFHLEGEPLSCTSGLAHEIVTQSDTASVNVRPYRLPEKHKQEVNKQISEMLQQKVIRSSTSQWNAPLLVVPKKADASGKQKLRIVIDFRKLNDRTVGDSFPIPNITDILDQLGSAKYFTTLDLASGYHQIEMAEKDKHKTAFSTPYGHYEFNRMPFGLKNAPATFQRLMNTILAGMQGLQCLVYLDDIVIYASSLEEHNKRLREVFNRLRKNKLKLQPEKCEFLRKEVIYLGHIITENGILPEPTKLDAVNKFPVPKNVKGIQSFIGLAGYYRRFIDNFSKIARPLTKLTKKDEKFSWSTEQQNAFETLKNKLTTAPVLQYPNFEQEFIVTSDASDYAIGAVLSQGTVGQDRPIAYASRVLSRAEKNYSTTEKELLAIVWAVKHFRPYLYGTKFKIITDHKPLTWLFSVNDPGSRLIRWRLKLEEYDYVILHKAGKANANADALSRNVIATVNVPNKEEGEEEENKNVPIRIDNEEEREKIIYEYHDAPIGGHQGIDRTLSRIRMKYTWPGITADVERYIARCEPCQKNKQKNKKRAPLMITDTPQGPFEKCALDIVGPLTITDNNNRYLLTFQDCLTKFSKAIPVPNQEANTIAKEFVQKIVLEHGIPDRILTDQGTNFLSEIFKDVCKLLKIEKIQTSAYHPESNGALERTHRTLTEYLRHYINDDQTDWDEWIPYAIFAFNTTPHTATGYTPFELLYGRQANLPSTLSTPPKLTYSYDNYAKELRERIRASNRVAKENLKEEKEKAKEYQDRKAKEIRFKVGDKVLLHDETLRRGRSKKLDALWIGPYIILEKNSDVNYTIKMGRRKLLTHVNRLKAYIDH